MADVTTKNKGMFSAYIPNYNIMKQYNDPDNAFVMVDTPSTVFMGADRANNPDKERVLQHEFAHQVEGKARQRYAPQGKASEMRAVSGFPYPPTMSFFLQALTKGRLGAVDSPSVIKGAVTDQENFKKQFESPAVKQRFTELFGELNSRGRLANPADSPFHEILADLNSYEMDRRVDVTQDPILRKQLFNNDERLIEAYRSVAPNRADRLDAKDLPPYTSQYVEPEPWYANTLRSLGF
jgi:hypothetical protein